MNTVKMPELKACPFCGASPTIGKWKEAIDQSDTCPTAIECSSDLVACPINPGICNFSRDEAVAAWNARAAVEASQPAASMIERAAKYGWRHSSWDWDSVRIGLEQFTPPSPKAEAVEGGSLMDYLNTGKLAAHTRTIPMTDKTMVQLPGDSPLMLAWNEYKRGPDYANTKNWATKPEHTDGSLWAAFSAGFNATPPESGGQDAVAWMQDVYDPETGIEYTTVTLNPSSVTSRHIPLYTYPPAQASGAVNYKAAYEAMVAGAEKALDEIEDDGPKALKYAAQELRAALQSADAAPAQPDGVGK